MIAEIQVLPAPPGAAGDRWSHVDAAIAVVVRSGLTHEVGPLGTTFEGPPDAVWAALRAAHEATLADGAESVVSVVKILQGRDASPTMHELTATHRPARG